MILQAGTSNAPVTAGTCSECGSPAGGNFCSSCGADLRRSALGFLGQAAAPVRRSFPVVYMKLLRAPIRATAALADDPTYRNYLAFALSGIALYCLFIVPVVMGIVVPAGGNVHVSESMMTLMKALSQVGVYVGILITFALAFVVFRMFAPAKRSLAAYFKLFCLALGFTAPINGAYEFVVANIIHGTGLTAVSAALSAVIVTAVTSAFDAVFAENGAFLDIEPLLQVLATPTGVSSLVLIVAMLVYYIGIHRRFWQMAIWKATLLYLGVSWVSNQIGYYLMWYVGFYTARVLINAGIVTN